MAIQRTAVVHPPPAPQTVAGLLVFSDLDGTLLERVDYSWQAAVPALEKLARANVPVILASSKTEAEMRLWRQRLNLDTPVIAENGALIAALPGAGDTALTLATPRRDFLPLLHELRRRWRLDFEGFADWDVDAIAGHTGLAPEDAARAAARSATEPLLWRDTPQRLELLRQALAARHLQIIRGGRFWHVQGECDKGRALVWLRNWYQRRHQRPFRALALGDAPNDASMLDAADIAVVVNGPLAEQLTPRAAHVYRTRAQGPAGWAEAIAALLPGHH